MYILMTSLLLLDKRGTKAQLVDVIFLEVWPYSVRQKVQLGSVSIYLEHSLIGRSIQPTSIFQMGTLALRLLREEQFVGFFFLFHQSYKFSMQSR